MDTNETKIHIALLTGVIVLTVLMALFVLTIARYHRKKVSLDEQKVRADFNLLDRERERIAFDLHDDLGGSLSFLKMHLHMLSNLNAENASTVLNLEKIIDDAMEKIRRISQNLMPRILQRRGLDAALEELTEMAGASSGLRINYGFSMDTPDQETGLHIYRIVQEIINNIVKHANATTVNLTIVEIGHKIELSIVDNGIGFEKSEVLKKEGMGLRNIAARTSFLKGTLYLDTAPGNGVNYFIEIPFYGKNKSSHR